MMTPKYSHNSLLTYNLSYIEFKCTSIKAFYLKGDKGVNLSPGTWHWTPFPINSISDFIILVRTNVKDDDLNFVDLEKRLNVKILIKV